MGQAWGRGVNADQRWGHRGSLVSQASSPFSSSGSGWVCLTFLLQCCFDTSSVSFSWGFGFLYRSACGGNCRCEHCSFRT